MNNVISPLLRYRTLLVMLFPLLALYTLIQALKYRSVKFLIQRLGVFKKPEKQIDIWIHAASVGEVSAALPLIKAIEELYPGTIFLVTTTTPTGASLLAMNDIGNTSHRFLPLDYVIFVSAFLKCIRPRCAIIMETEIWPNLFKTCHKHNIPLCTVNGRLSNKTLKTLRWVKQLYKITLQYSSAILTRSEADTKAYISLGAKPDKVKTIGNIKFSADLHAQSNQQTALNRPYILAASTHDDEEALIAALWKERKLNKSAHLLAIAPRHPQRLTALLKQLENLHLNIAVRSRKDDINASTDIYIIDTVGELIGFMKSAELIFVGGSLVPIGGHNILEPAWLSKPILFGPYMHNFENEAEKFLDYNAAIQVENISQLGNKLEELIPNSQKRNELGKNARQLVEQQKDIANRYVSELSGYLDK